MNSTQNDENFLILRLIKVDLCIIDHQLAQLQLDLQRMNAENQRLKEMLGQVTNNYNALQMHLVAVVQQQNQAAADQTSQDHDQVILVHFYILNYMTNNNIDS